MHGGQVQVRSTLGGGSTFSVFLPAAPMSPAGPVKGRVLVIEDDRDIALGIRTLLTRSGFDVANSADGKHGLRVFHAARPDLVVLDIGLPTLDGWQVLERIRDLSDVPVLILTAHGHEADKVRGLHGGADDYLTKPFGNRELAARVEALLRRPRAGAASRGLRRRPPAGPARLAGGQRERARRSR